LKKLRHRVLVAGKINLILGYAEKRNSHRCSGRFGAVPHVAVPHVAIHTYCNIVKPQIVGNINAKLLKTILVEGKHSDVITKTFTNIQYVPVQTKSFEDVKIFIRTDIGDPVPFERMAIGSWTIGL
jgi:hypothetical protein